MAMASTSMQIGSSRSSWLTDALAAATVSGMKGWASVNSMSSSPEADSARPSSNGPRVSTVQ